MKRIVVTIVIIAVLVGGYGWVRNQQVSLTALEGVKTKVRRGDLEMPITANGHIQPASVTKMKGEASGEVVETPFDVGMMVRKGDLLIRLDPTDEQRNVDRAKADRERARINRERAKTTLDQTQTVGLALAGAKQAQAEARQLRANTVFEKTKRLHDSGQTSQYEYNNAKANKDEADAALDAAKAEVTQAGIAVDLAEQDVTIAEENLRAAEKVYEDTLERLAETKVYSPVHGMVLSRAVQVGEVVQSGKTSLTGGTVLVELADVSDIYAVVNVDEADIGLVRELAPPEARPGPTATQPARLPAEAIDDKQLVEVKVESLREEVFRGVIERISPQSEVSQAIATFKVWIRVVGDNRDKLIGLLNARAEAHFMAKSVTNAILVNYDAFQKDPNGDGFGVYIPEIKEGEARESAKFVACKFGADNGIDVEVIEGLEEGDEVWVQLPKKTRKEKEAEQENEDAE